jgi:hypothetical protein
MQCSQTLSAVWSFVDVKPRVLLFANVFYPKPPLLQDFTILYNKSESFRQQVTLHKDALIASLRAGTIEFEEIIGPNQFQTQIVYNHGFSNFGHQVCLSMLSMVASVLQLAK